MVVLGVFRVPLTTTNSGRTPQLAPDFLGCRCPLARWVIQTKTASPNLDMVVTNETQWPRLYLDPPLIPTVPMVASKQFKTWARAATLPYQTPRFVGLPRVLTSWYRYIASAFCRLLKFDCFSRESRTRVVQLHF